MVGLMGGQMVIEASFDFMNLNVLMHTPPYFGHRVWIDLVGSCKNMVFLTPWPKSFGSTATISGRDWAMGAAWVGRGVILPKTQMSHTAP